MERIIKYTWILGFLGFLGFIPKTNGQLNYLFFAFFAFFSYLLMERVGKLEKNRILFESINRAKSLTLGYLITGVFIILFLLDRNMPKRIPLLVGVIIYVITFYLYPIIILKLTKK